MLDLGKDGEPETQWQSDDLQVLDPHYIPKIWGTTPLKTDGCSGWNGCVSGPWSRWAKTSLLFCTVGIALSQTKGSLLKYSRRHPHILHDIRHLPNLGTYLILCQTSCWSDLSHTHTPRHSSTWHKMPPGRQHVNLKMALWRVTLG